MKKPFRIQPKGHRFPRTIPTQCSKNHAESGIIATLEKMVQDITTKRIR